MGRTAGLIFLAKIFAPSSTFAILYALGRIHGVEPVGQFNACITILTVFQFFGGLGLDSYLTREAARAPEEARGLLQGIRRYVLWICIASILTAVCGTTIAGYSQPMIEAVGIGSLALLPFALVSLCDATFIGLGRTKTVAWISLFENALRLSLSVAVIFFHFNLLLLMAAHVIGKGSALILYGIATARLPKAHTSTHTALPHLRTVTTFMGILMVYAIFWKVDVLLLSRIRGDYEAGVYSMANKAVMIFFMAPSSLVTAALPRLSSAFAHDRAQVDNIFKKTAGAVSFYFIPISLILMLRGGDLFNLLRLGSRFAVAGPIVPILAGVLAMMSLIEVCFRTMLSAGLERRGFWVGFRSMIVCLFGVGAATWIGGYRATAWAMLACVGFDLAQNLWYVRRLVNGLPKVFLQILTEGAVLGVILYGVRQCPLIAFLCIAFSVHLFLSHVIGILKIGELRELLNDVVRRQAA